MTQQFFWRNLSSLKVLLQTFEKFERVSSLKLNLDKSEICGIGVKKGGADGVL